MTTSLDLDDDMASRLASLAETRKRPAKATMVEAIRRYVVRESFRTETMESWAACQRDGLRLTGDEVMIWLEHWGRDGGGDMPTLPQLIVTAAAAAACGIDRCRRFLSEVGPAASNRAARTIARRLTQLRTGPQSAGQSRTIRECASW